MLSTRLTHLTVYPAAGAASFVAPEAAVIAFVPETLGAVGTLKAVTAGTGAGAGTDTGRLRTAAITTLYNTACAKPLATASAGKEKALSAGST